MGGSDVGIIIEGSIILMFVHRNCLTKPTWPFYLFFSFHLNIDAHGYSFSLCGPILKQSINHSTLSMITSIDQWVQEFVIRTTNYTTSIIMHMSHTLLIP